MVTITRQFLNQGKSTRGGWSSKQFECLVVGAGMEWKGFCSMEAGWLRALIGKKMLDEFAVEFLKLKDIHIAKREEKRRKAIEKQADKAAHKALNRVAGNHKAPFIQIPEGTVLTWQKQYNHPNWQKKRVMIFSRDNFTCTKCGNKHEQLHVHHECYEGRFIWDTPSCKLKTICHSCHEKAHGRKI